MSNTTEICQETYVAFNMPYVTSYLATDIRYQGQLDGAAMFSDKMVHKYEVNYI